MLALELRFPGGRYHATPWDAHVNEGRVEWPPSPWRILRALHATWDLKARDAISPEVLAELLATLATVPPVYRLPTSPAGSHTRHYMPLFKDKTTKVLDTFLHVDRTDRVVVGWPGVTLDPRGEQALETLVERLGYLGRAESWVDGCLVSDWSEECNCRPSDWLPSEGRPPAGRSSEGRPSEGDADRDLDSLERVRLLAPCHPDEHDAWRASWIEKRCAGVLEAKQAKALAGGKPVDRVKLTAKDRAKVEAAVPETTLEVLSAVTSALRKAGWNRPPGTRWVEYFRPKLEEQVQLRPRPAPPDTPTVARFALAGAVLPRLTDAIFEAEKLRVALLAHSDGAPVFSGRDSGSGELLEGHLHAQILPESNGRHGRITHMTLFARMGFSDRARAALRSLHTLWQRKGHDLQLVLLGVGSPEDFGGTRIEVGECPLLASSKTWVSRTPFVATRHPKLRRDGSARPGPSGRALGSPEDDLVRLLTAQGFPEPQRVEPIAETNLGGKPTRWLAFKTRRRSGNGRRASSTGVGFRLEFPEPIRGPIAVGYGAHFGLGQFTPTRGFNELP